MSRTGITTLLCYQLKRVNQKCHLLNKKFVFQEIEWNYGKVAVYPVVIRQDTTIRYKLVNCLIEIVPLNISGVGIVVRDRHKEKIICCWTHPDGRLPIIQQNHVIDMLDKLLINVDCSLKVFDVAEQICMILCNVSLPI